MNPLFISHLIGDFLLQPKWLVEMKKRSGRGVVLHSAIHATVMIMIVLPENLAIFLCILGIAAIHGLIDQLKIDYANKKHTLFTIPFMLDQAMHLLTMLLASTFFSFTNSFWQGGSGRWTLTVLFILSFALAWKNLSSIKVDPQQNTGTLIGRFSLIAVTFAMFAIPSVLFLKPFYLWL